MAPSLSAGWIVMFKKWTAALHPLTSCVPQWALKKPSLPCNISQPKTKQNKTVYLPDRFGQVYQTPIVYSHRAGRDLEIILHQAPSFYKWRNKDQRGRALSQRLFRGSNSSLFLWTFWNLVTPARELDSQITSTRLFFNYYFNPSGLFSDERWLLHSVLYIFTYFPLWEIPLPAIPPHQLDN